MFVKIVIIALPLFKWEKSVADSGRLRIHVR